MTKEQDVILARSRIADLKQKFMQSLAAYTRAATGNPAAALGEALAMQAQATAYFNYAEDFVGNSDLLGAHKSALWAQGFAEDCNAILSSIPEYYAVLRTAFGQIPQLAGQVPTPDVTAYANMQRMVVAFLPQDIVRALRARFVAAHLPVFGFDNEAKVPMNKQLNTWLAYAFGFIFVIVMLAIAWFKPEPTDFQYTIFRGAFAMALAGIAAVIPGFLHVQWSNWLKAGGALAVFVVVYFWNPALPKGTPASPQAGPSNVQPAPAASSASSGK